MFQMGGGVAPEDQLDKTQKRRVMARVIRMASPFRRTAYAALGCVVVTTSATLAAPVLVRHGIDAGIRARDPSAQHVGRVAAARTRAAHLGSSGVVRSGPLFFYWFKQ